MPHVAVVGAGIAGLSAAHELACRGYDVTVYEPRERDAVGGKCRSQFFAHGGGTLPGEHGFRFFPGFYQHVPETMARIPQDPATADTSTALTPYADSVADRLVPCDAMGIARPGMPLAEIKLDRVDTMSEVLAAIRFMWTVLMPVRKRDVLHLSQRFLRYLCTCDERRLKESGNQTLWDYVGGDTLHPETQAVLQNVPKSLVAMDAKQGNTRTFFNTLWLMNSEWMIEQDSHRVLNGPTSDTWLYPWRDWVERLGATFEFETLVEELVYDAAAKRVTGVRKRQVGGGPLVEVLFDHVILAVPIEAAQTLVTAAMAADCGQCAAVTSSAPGAMLGWMAGAQFYLQDDAPLLNGHIGYVYSPWGLTSVSQEQFWRDQHLAAHPGIGGVLSVCITNFDEPDPTTGKTAMESTEAEMRQAILRQIRECLVGHPDEAKLADANIVTWHLDQDLDVGPSGVTDNRSRLLIHPPAQWDARPEPVADVAGLFMAGDYVRNPADLATMEGAIASSRAAVNGVLAADGSAAQKVPTYDLLDMFEPTVVKNRKQLDQVLFDNGLEPLAIGDVLHPLLDDLDDPDDISLDMVFDVLASFDVKLATALAGGGGGSPPPGGGGLIGGFLESRTRDFAFPTFIPMIRADQDAWTHLLGKYDGRLPAPGRAMGLIRDISALASDGFDPSQLHPLIRSFYSETTRFSMQANVQWEAPLVGPLWSGLADFFDQLDPGPGNRTAHAPMDTKVADLPGFPNAPLGARLWRRRFGDERKAFYTAVLRPYIGQRRDGAGTVTHLHVLFPYPVGNLSVVLELQTLPGGGFRASSRPSDTHGRDTGTWLVPAMAPWAAFRAPFADGEQITLRPQGSLHPYLSGQHEAAAFGRPVLSLGYIITD